MFFWWGSSLTSIPPWQIKFVVWGSFIETFCSIDLLVELSLPAVENQPTKSLTILPLCQPWLRCLGKPLFKMCGFHMIKKLEVAD